jgi:hypothetical protein
MNSEGVSKDDVKVPEGDLGKEIQAGFDDGKDLLVTIISAMGEEQVRVFLAFFYIFQSIDHRHRRFPTRKRLKGTNATRGGRLLDQKNSMIVSHMVGRR